MTPPYPPRIAPGAPWGQKKGLPWGGGPETGSPGGLTPPGPPCDYAVAVTLTLCSALWGPWARESQLRGLRPLGPRRLRALRPQQRPLRPQAS